MLRIDRYIAKYFLGFFLGGMLVFLTVFLAVDVLSTFVSYKGVAASSLIQFYILYIPDIVQKLIPVSCLLATILTLSSLNKANELVALFAAGYSLLRVATPILVIVLGISFFSFYLSDRVIPSLTRQKNYIFYHEIKKTPSQFSIVKTNRIWYRSKNEIFNIKTLSLDGSKAQGLTLYTFDPDWELQRMIVAEEVDLKNKQARNASGQYQWFLKKGSVTVFFKDSSFPMTTNFKEKTIIMNEEAKDLQSSGQTSEMLSQKELEKFIEKNKEAGLDTIRYEVDYHSKFAFAFAGLVMTILGIPFSVSKGRSGGVMMNVGIVIGLVFFYWIFYNSSITLGTHGHLQPLLAGWIPNLVMMVLGIFFLIKSKK
ncbi:MAG: LPS export ABC transporter permease LptG [Bdellovibrionaceae bacterium]|nr:LPS export ABC transporter permease LptG [Pseudobdellovibrionaceae bacterium]NUM59631.1 LPS export ABC transporter permease LptG [Pseudobdellovibrionaceae bacterium]